ncbi:MAG: TRAP transporter substrate-binding protein DctP [Acidobacteria bacterium]|nr:TRAP transporter substrate-binding protein DctP [Acidobacteriota bacterium]
MKLKTALTPLMAILTMTASLSFTGIPGAYAAKTTTVRLGTLAPRGSSFHNALVEMGEKWRNASGGEIKLIIYPDGTQGGEADMVRLMRARALTAGMFSVIGLSEIDRSVGGLSFLPLTFRSAEEYDYVVEKLSPRLEKLLLEKGFVVLFWGDAGWVRFFSTKPAIHPDDFKQFKIYTSAGTNNQVDLMKSLGYTPVALETADILTGLRTGMIDAISMPPNLALMYQCYTVAKHMLALKWSILAGATVIRRDTWETIDPALRGELLDAAAEAGKIIRKSARQEDEESIAAMRKKDLIVHPVAPEVEKEWYELNDILYPRIRGNIVPADIFDEVQRLVGEYRAKESGK